MTDFRSDMKDSVKDLVNRVDSSIFPQREDCIEEYFNLDKNDLRRFSKEECVLAQHALLSSSVFIQRKINELKIGVKINKSFLDRIIAEKIPDFEKYTKYDIIVSSVVNEYEYVKEAADETLRLECVIQGLEGTVEKIDKMVQVFRDLSFCKT